MKNTIVLEGRIDRIVVDIYLYSLPIYLVIHWFIYLFAYLFIFLSHLIRLFFLTFILPEILSVYLVWWRNKTYSLAYLNITSHHKRCAVYSCITWKLVERNSSITQNIFSVFKDPYATKEQVTNVGVQPAVKRYGVLSNMTCTQMTQFKVTFFYTLRVYNLQSTKFAT